MVEIRGTGRRGLGTTEVTVETYPDFRILCVIPEQPGRDAIECQREIWRVANTIKAALEAAGY